MQVIVHYFFLLSVFGFVNETLTAVESTDFYRVEVAFFSGRPAFGGFPIFLQYNAGTASEWITIDSLTNHAARDKYNIGS